jgi:GABA(A) receptor-associated protein
MSADSNTNTTPFQRQHSLERRKAKFQAFSDKHRSGKIVPLIIEAGSFTPFVGKSQFAIPKERAFGHVTASVNQMFCKGAGASEEDAARLTYIVGGRYVPGDGDALADIYSKYADEDGFLYVTYTLCVPVLAKSGNADTPSLRNALIQIPGDRPFGVLAQVVRERLQSEASTASEQQTGGRCHVLGPADALYFFVGNTLPSHGQLVSQVYREGVSSEDRLLHVTYTVESTFG